MGNDEKNSAIGFFYYNLNKNNVSKKIKMNIIDLLVAHVVDIYA